MLKKILKYLIWGIAWGCTFFVLIGILMAVIGGDEVLERIAADFTRQAFGSIMTGICCGSSAIVYTFKRLKMWQCVCIHFTVGLTGYFYFAFTGGWMPVGHIGYTVSFIMFGVGIFGAIWLLFYLSNRKDAKRVNERLRELEQEEEATEEEATEEEAKEEEAKEEEAKEEEATEEEAMAGKATAGNYD